MGLTTNPCALCGKPTEHLPDYCDACNEAMQCSYLTLIAPPCPADCSRSHLHITY